MPELSIIIPAYNEAVNIGPCLDELLEFLHDRHHLDLEVLVVNDNSKDVTEREVMLRKDRWPQIRLVRRVPPNGFGRAIRTGLEFVRGDIVVVYMADRSDHPEDVLRYVQKLREGYDCVFGSRFIRGSTVQNYPRTKLIVNRIVNKLIQLLFWTSMNDLTNAFKAYRRKVIEDCGPYRSSHFNITLEMSLSALIREYKICQIPINWQGRTWGSSNLRLREMGRRYLCTLFMVFAQRILISDDVRTESHRRAGTTQEIDALEQDESSGTDQETL